MRGSAIAAAMIATTTWAAVQVGVPESLPADRVQEPVLAMSYDSGLNGRGSYAVRLTSDGTLTFRGPALAFFPLHRTTWTVPEGSVRTAVQLACMATPDPPRRSPSCPSVLRTTIRDGGRTDVTYDVGPRLAAIENLLGISWSTSDLGWLDWLGRHQSAAGHWSAAHFSDECAEDGPLCVGSPGLANDRFTTAMGAIALQCFGHRPFRTGGSAADAALSAALAWLLVDRAEDLDPRALPERSLAADAATLLALGVRPRPDGDAPDRDAERFCSRAIRQVSRTLQAADQAITIETMEAHAWALLALRKYRATLHGSDSRRTDLDPLIAQMERWLHLQARQRRDALDPSTAEHALWLAIMTLAEPMWEELRPQRAALFAGFLDEKGAGWNPADRARAVLAIVFGLVAPNGQITTEQSETLAQMLASWVETTGCGRGALRTSGTQGGGWGPVAATAQLSMIAAWFDHAPNILGGR